MAITDPWRADTATILAAGSVRHLVNVIITAADGSTLGVPLIEGTLSYDEGRSPRVEATLTTHLNVADSLTLGLIDPRRNTRALISVGYDRPDGFDDIQTIADLSLRTRTRTRPDDTLELVARSDESLVIDASPAATFAVSQATTADAIQAIFAQVSTGDTFTSTVSPAGPAVSINQPDSDRWTVMADLADQIGAVLYDDGYRAWWLTNRPNTLTTPAVTLSDGPAGTLIAVTEEMDRDAGYANMAYLVYEWTDGAGNPHRIVSAKGATGTFAPSPATAPIRILRITRAVPVTQTQADAAATTLAARTVTRGRVFTITAISCYWLRPGHTVAIAEAGRGTENHLITAVEFDLAAGLMRLTTRVPE